MKELVIMKINEYIDRYLFPPSLNWPPYYFNDRSDAMWAAKEIIDRIEKSDSSPYIVIEQFSLITREYSYQATGSRASRMFDIANGVANDILNMFQMEGDMYEI